MCEYIQYKMRGSIKQNGVQTILVFSFINDTYVVVWIVQHGIEEGWHWEINKQTKKNTMYMLVL